MPPVLPLLSAKYPYLQLRIPGTKDEKEKGRPVLHFGSVAIGQSLQKHFDISNPSTVSRNKDALWNVCSFQCTMTYLSLPLM